MMGKQRLDLIEKFQKSLATKEELGLSNSKIDQHAGSIKELHGILSNNSSKIKTLKKDLINRKASSAENNDRVAISLSR